jgi:hypothetical protein
MLKTSDLIDANVGKAVFYSTKDDPGLIRGAMVVKYRIDDQVYGTFADRDVTVTLSDISEIQPEDLSYESF